MNFRFMCFCLFSFHFIKFHCVCTLHNINYTYIQTQTHISIGECHGNDELLKLLLDLSSLLTSIWAHTHSKVNLSGLFQTCATNYLESSVCQLTWFAFELGSDAFTLTFFECINSLSSLVWCLIVSICWPLYVPFKLDHLIFSLFFFSLSTIVSIASHHAHIPNAVQCWQTVNRSDARIRFELKTNGNWVN